jgi:hypothetical protein
MGNRSDYQATYTNLTPMVRSERHLTSHDLLMVSGLMMRMNWSGIPMGLAISSKAPVSDRLRIVQSTRPRSKEIVPPLKVRCLELSRFSSIAGVLRCAAELDKGKSHKNQTGQRHTQIQPPGGRNRRVPKQLIPVLQAVEYPLPWRVARQGLYRLQPVVQAAPSLQDFFLPQPYAGISQHRRRTRLRASSSCGRQCSIRRVFEL